MPSHIFTVQRPLVRSGDDVPNWLVYREWHLEMAHLDPTERMLDMTGDDVKMCVRGRMKSNEFVAEERVEDQPW